MGILAVFTERSATSLWCAFICPMSKLEIDNLSGIPFVHSGHPLDRLMPKIKIVLLSGDTMGQYLALESLEHPSIEK